MKDTYSLTSEKLEVVFNNNFNKESFSALSVSEYNLLMGAIGKLRNKGIERVSIPLEECLILTDNIARSPGELASLTGRTWEKIKGVSYEVRSSDDKSSGGVSLFSYFLYDSESEELQISINPDLAYFVNHFERGNYTSFNHKEFRQVSTTYSKSLFKLLSQYKETGYYVVKSEELRALLGCPKSYNTGRFHKIVLDPSIKEVSNVFKDLQVDKIKRGNKIVRYEFKFKKIKNNKEWDEGFRNQKSAKKSERTVKEVNPTYAKQEDGDMSMEEYAHEVEKLFVK